MDPKEEKNKIALGIEYQGTNYHGWQKQSLVPNTVQEVLQKSLTQVANEPVVLNCSGRTDSGVHALSQVVDFSIRSTRNEKAWIMGANSLLPKDIKIIWFKKVSNTFHARFSALSRTYTYLIRNTSTPSALWANRCLFYQYELDCVAMKKGSKILLGEHDFSAFRSSGCQSISSNRKIDSIEIKKIGNFVSITITANAFLQNMVRIIIGTLLDVGSGFLDYSEIENILYSKERNLASYTARADGLYFMGPSYPEKYKIPSVDLNLFKL